ncbi:MAG TPA: DUF455 family protein [Phototrophicaceae bacterium]|nr:DUF455 family protein [Phototrophicaceae bacterium]
MSEVNAYLPGQRDRARYMRLDVARILKRFHFCERALIIAQAGWIAGIAPLDIKITLPRHFWEDALTANELRNRVFELRYPSRLLEPGDDAPVIDLFEEAIQAPGALAFVLALARVYKPALLEAYRAYLDMADVIADGPSVRFLRAAVTDKERQLHDLNGFATDLLKAAAADEQTTAYAWVAALQQSFDRVGGLGIDAPNPAGEPLTAPLAQRFQFAEVPARDARFNLCRFYWPNIIDPNFAYGEGILLQLRSAVSHVNEVWAIETGGAILNAFAHVLDWEFTLDAARWTYDEARHTTMGYERLTGWGFTPAEIPLGTYIFDSAKGEPPIIRIGMLHYFETKNIGKKNDRAEAFASYHDDVSQHDMEFDWADETIHAHYGAKWIKVLREKFPELPDSDAIHERCDALVNALVETATEEDRRQIYDIAGKMIDKAQHTLEAVS